MSNRDEFGASVKATLAKRVNYLCSNPECLRPTSGPSSDPEKYISIGVAAHIEAAALGGKRYNTSQTQQERASIRNGIWLCQNCSVLIDRDEQRFTVDILRQWKKTAEKNADLLSPKKIKRVNRDSEIVELIRMSLDRPAFHDRFNYECNLIHFRQALDDTVSALSTGLLRDRKGNLISKGYGISYLLNPNLLSRSLSILSRTKEMRIQYDPLERQDKIQTHNNYSMAIDHEIDRFFDETRDSIFKEFNQIAAIMGILPLTP